MKDLNKSLIVIIALLLVGQVLSIRMMVSSSKTSFLEKHLIKNMIKNEMEGDGHQSIVSKEHFKAQHPKAMILDAPEPESDEDEKEAAPEVVEDEPKGAVPMAVASEENEEPKDAEPEETKPIMPDEPENAHEPCDEELAP